MQFLIRGLASALLLAALLGVLLIALALAYLRPQLPDVRALEHVQLQLPMRVVSAEGVLLGEFGEQRRIPVAYADIPPVLTQAILAAEDDRFFAHPGVDAISLVRAALAYARTGARRQGGSTITMQVARNFFLTPDKTLRRKVLEILLALEIERTLSKQEIFTLYVNRIFLGHRAYGFAAAAQVYYDRPLAEISLDQAATLAGLPKAPSRDNPLTNADRARQRRDYVLRRMQALGMVTTEQAQAAASRPVAVVRRQAQAHTGAPYVAEAARQWMVDRFGDTAYAGGYVVHTTVRANAQRAAEQALRAALETYDQRRGWRGPVRRLDPKTRADPQATDAALGALGSPGGLHAAVVTGRQGARVDLVLPGGRSLQLQGEALARAGQAAAGLKAGDVVRVRSSANAWVLAQEPAAEGALVAMVPDSGAITSLVGGYDFARSSFNRALQADRQPGSAFKPFIYAGALAAGFTPASVVNDAPVVYRTDTVEGIWRPENYSREFYGPTRLREALAQSRNLVSIRLLEQIGVDFGRNYTLRFGFPPRKVPQAISLALGTGAMTPLELAAGYAVIANGGYRVTPYLVDRVEDRDGTVVFQTPPARPCEVDCPPEQTDAAAAPRVIPATDAYLLYSMLQEVIRSGTGAAARALGRTDLAGKTGTTNDSRDAWFAGFTPDLLAVTWVGFDQPRTLGKRETGGRAALPMWMDYMRAALAGTPVRPMPMPDGIVMLPVNRETGAQATPGDPQAMTEVFDVRHPPSAAPSGSGYGPAQAESVPADLF